MDAPTAAPTRPSPGLDAGWAETTTLLRAFIARRVDNPQVADDITQDVLTRSLAGGALDSVDNPTGWFYRAARNAVIDHYRLRRRHQPLFDADDRWAQPVGDDSGPNHATRELARCLQPLIDQLPPMYHGRAHPRRSPRGNPPACRSRCRHLGVRHEVTRPARPRPTPRPPHHLLRRAHRHHWRDPLLPRRRSPLRLQLPLSTYCNVNGDRPTTQTQETIPGGTYDTLTVG